MNKKPTSNKKRIVKDYDALPEDILNQIKLKYPRGFAENLVYYTDQHGKKVSALPFETEEIYYLVRMTVQEAKQIIEEDDDYDESGTLRNDFGSDTSEGDDDDLPQAQGLDEVYQHEVSTVELDPEYQEQQTKEAMHKDSEYADVDFDSLNLDGEDEEEKTEADAYDSYDEYEDYEDDLGFKGDKKSPEKD
jgi:DNA-directed RNA polymerase subunit delta